MKISSKKAGKNLLDAIINGTLQGIKTAVSVAAMLLVFMSFIALMNFILQKIGLWAGWNDHIYEWTNGTNDKLSLQFIFSYLFYPVIWLLNVNSQDITLIGRLLGEKIIMSEFAGYISLANLKEAGGFASTKSIIVAIYMLSGFANFVSVGIQIGGIGSLAPKKQLLLSQLGLKALLAGTLTSLLSATIVSILLN